MEGATFSRNYSRIELSVVYLRIALLAILERTESKGTVYSKITTNLANNKGLYFQTN
jgi:hypothetical protein